MARRKRTTESTDETPDDAPAVAWRFTGARDRHGRPLAFFMGIPARDLTEADYAKLSPDLQTLVRQSALYAGEGDAAGDDASGGEGAHEPEQGSDGNESGDATGDA